MPPPNQISNLERFGWLWSHTEKITVTSTPYLAYVVIFCWCFPDIRDVSLLEAWHWHGQGWGQDSYSTSSGRRDSNTIQHLLAYAWCACSHANMGPQIPFSYFLHHIHIHIIHSLRVATCCMLLEILRLKPTICWALPSNGLWHGAGVRYDSYGAVEDFESYRVSTGGTSSHLPYFSGMFHKINHLWNLLCFFLICGTPHIATAQHTMEVGLECGNQWRFWWFWWQCCWDVEWHGTFMAHSLVASP